MHYGGNIEDNKIHLLYPFFFGKATLSFSLLPIRLSFKQAYPRFSLYLRKFAII